MPFTDEHRLQARVARLYYEAGLTQAQIGRQLGMSRIKVSRILREAREAGVVEVRIAGPDDGTAELEDVLLVTWQLQDVVVVETATTTEALRDRLAEGAARWLERELRPGLRIGLGLGRTISRLPEAFRPATTVDCTFTEIEGAAPSDVAGFGSYNVTARMAVLAGGRAELISAPTFVSSRQLRDRLLEEPVIRDAIERARGCDVVVQSVGTVSPTALLYLHGVVTAEDLALLRARGAVGDALGHYFDRAGNHIPFRTDDCHIGLTLDDLRRVRRSVLVAGGEDKVDAIEGGLRGRYFNVLVTDVETAARLRERRP
jgi:deoxyribonucleoside regulator